MSHTLDLLAEAQHGTVAGYRAGCHGSAASCGGTVSCATVYIRYQADWGFRKRIDAGEDAGVILAAELADADNVKARDKAANRRAKEDGARAASDREKKQRRLSSVVVTESSESLAERIVDDVRRLAGEKKTVHEIAKTLGVSVTTVTRARRAAGVHSTRKQIDRDEIRRLHAEGWNDTRIGEHLGTSNSAISVIRGRELGLPTVKTDRRKNEKVESERARRSRLITDLNAEGKTDTEIADILGVPYYAANQARSRLGLPLNPDPNRNRRREAHTTGEATPTPARPSAEGMDPSLHGTADGYDTGCRGRSCPSTPTCTDAALARNRAARRAAEATK